jgi:hypothetical protein
MPVTYGTSFEYPWLDNWPIDIQLWANSNRGPGDELDLTPATITVLGVSVPRALTVRWRDGNNAIAVSSTTVISIRHAKRGVVRVVPDQSIWDKIKLDQGYTLEVVAYGTLQHSEPFTTATPPAATSYCVNGALVYAAPREVLEVLGSVPGASVQIAVPLVGLDWELNALGYWEAELADDQVLYGLWVDDQHAAQVDYKDLATRYERSWARVGNTLYYNGPENLATTYVETAYSRYVLRCLEEATAEGERRTGRRFAKWRYIRQAYNGLNRQRQVHLRERPFVADEFFKIDALSYSRTLFRRYTEKDFDPLNIRSSGAQLLHGDAETGVITINQNIWDYWDWGFAVGADIGIGTFATLPPGLNNVELTYTAGFDKIPTDIAEAIANMAAVRQAIFWQQALTQGMQALSIGCVNLNFGQLFTQFSPSWQLSANLILDSYARLDLDIL